MKVSIQGQVASYSHIAIKNLFDNLKLDLFFRDSFAEVFKDIEEELVEFGLLPVQNSTYGHITEVWDSLGNFNVNIISEIYVKVNFHLISFLGNDIENIRFVYSHPVALKQVKGFLAANPQIKSFEYPDTAGAVKFVQESFKNHKNKNEYAAICFKRSCKYVWNVYS